jgi:hypothetical protein
MPSGIFAARLPFLQMRLAKYHTAIWASAILFAFSSGSARGLEIDDGGGMPQRLPQMGISCHPKAASDHFRPDGAASKRSGQWNLPDGMKQQKSRNP